MAFPTTRWSILFGMPSLSAATTSSQMIEVEELSIERSPGLSGPVLPIGVISCWRSEPVVLEVRACQRHDHPTISGIPDFERFDVDLRADRIGEQQLIGQMVLAI